MRGYKSFIAPVTAHSTDTLQEKVSNSTAAEWLLMELSADDVIEYDDEDTNSIAAAEAVTSPGLHHLCYTLTGLIANRLYAGRL